MSKLVTLKDRTTGETIYPKVPTSSVLDENTGSNILGYVETELNKTEKEILKTSSTIKTIQEKIKTLDGIEKTPSELNLANNVVQVLKNKQSVETIQEKKEKITNTLQNESVDKNSVSNNDNIIDTTTSKILNRAYIRSCTPKYSPNKRQLRIGSDGHLYVGIGKIWYKSINSFITVISEEEN